MSPSFFLMEDKKKGFQCPECGKALASAQVVEKHLVALHGDKYAHLGIPCRTCGKVFHKSTIAAHELTHDDTARSGKRARRGEGGPDDNGKWVCPHCDEDFGSKSRFYNHMKKAHDRGAVYKTTTTQPPKPREYPCKGACGVLGCERTFSHPQKVEAHVAKVTGIKTRVCEFCGNAYSNTSDLKKHQLACVKRPGAGIETFPCTSITVDEKVCTYVGSSSTALSQHLNGPCHTIRHVLHFCKAEGCTYSHYHPGKIRQHAVIHEEDRPFKCAQEDCGAAFKTHGDLKRHSSVHETARDHLCALCEKAFTSDRYLSCHMQQSHGAKVHKCDVCDSQFSTKVYLDHHKTIHAEDAPFTCPTCSRTFRQKTVLDNHIAYVHSRHRVHKCQLCDFVFTSPSRLATHVKIHDIGFVPGKSRGEREIYGAIAAAGHRFLPEFTFPGLRTRYDFAIFGEKDLLCLIEYDGKGHYGPIFNSRICQEGFIQQVGRDLAKTRYTREHGIGLLRYTLAQYTNVVDDITKAAWVTNTATYRDYVFGDVFQPGCVFVESAKRAAMTATASTFMGDDAAAVEMLLCLPQVQDFVAALQDDEDSTSLFDFATLHLEAIVILFADRHKNTTVEDVAATSPRATQAFLHLFLQIPEFSNHATVGLLSHGLTDSSVIEPADGKPFMTCWMCEPPVRFKAKLSVGFAMLDHMAKMHAGHHFPVGCPFCSASREHQPLSCSGEWVHSSDCTMSSATEALRKYKRCQTCQTNFSVPHLLFRHLNDVHGAKFADVCTLKCSACGDVFKTSSAIRQHACSKEE